MQVSHVPFEYAIFHYDVGDAVMLITMLDDGKDNSHENDNDTEQQKNDDDI